MLAPYLDLNPLGDRRRRIKMGGPERLLLGVTFSDNEGAPPTSQNKIKGSK